MILQYFWTFLSHLRRFDWILFLLVLILVLFGLGAIFSLSLTSEEAPFLKFQKQLIFVLCFLFLAILLGFINYRNLFHLSIVFFIFVLVLFVTVLFLGESIRGTKSWFALGPFNLQPVELGKIALILILARFFSLRQNKKISWSDLLKSAALTLMLAIPVMLQPDLGSAIILIALWFCFLLFSASKKQIILIIILLGILIASSWFVLADYQKARVLAVFSPQVDPLGSSYNLRQATMAIGSGKILGQGLGKGAISQLHFLPEAETDFIFAVLAESFGFLGLSLVLLFWLFIFFALFRRAKMLRERFGFFIVLGFAFLLIIEVIINIGMNMGFFPVIGIGLPFASYGGSSLLAHFIGLGIVQSVISHSRI